MTQQINLNMDDAPEECLLILNDDDTRGSYIMSGWRSARAWRTNAHVTATPLDWLPMPISFEQLQAMGDEL